MSKLADILTLEPTQLNIKEKLLFQQALEKYAQGKQIEIAPLDLLGMFYEIEINRQLEEE